MKEKIIYRLFTILRKLEIVSSTLKRHELRINAAPIRFLVIWLMIKML